MALDTLLCWFLELLHCWHYESLSSDLKPRRKLWIVARLVKVQLLLLWMEQQVLFLLLQQLNYLAESKMGSVICVILQTEGVRFGCIDWKRLIRMNAVGFRMWKWSVFWDRLINAPQKKTVGPEAIGCWLILLSLWVHFRSLASNVWCGWACFELT
jgi:hypothetical protein